MHKFDAMLASWAGLGSGMNFDQKGSNACKETTTNKCEEPLDTRCMDVCVRLNANDLLIASRNLRKRHLRHKTTFFMT